MNPDYKALFLEESQGQIKQWEDALLVLEKSPEDQEMLHELLRAIHTLKGSAGFVGCEEMRNLAHKLESAMVPEKDEDPRLLPGVIDLLFDGLDVVRRIIDAIDVGDPVEGTARALLDRLDERLGTPAAAQAAPQPTAPRGPLYRINIHIEAPTAERYLRALLVQTRLEEIGTIVAVNPTLEELRLQDAEFEYGVVVETDRPPAALEAALNIDQVHLQRIQPVGTPGEEAESGGAKEGPDPAAETGGATAKAENVVRVPASKLDAMLNLVGELVVQNSGFLSLARDLRAAYGGSALVGSLEEKTEMLTRVARQLQDAVMKVRMLPAAAVFSRFPRVVRDLAKSSGKEIQLQITGGETEIDKKVIDRVSEPLVHLVRNAADHGIENALDRQAAGKDASGLIRISAYQEGDRLCLEVSDDGRGLDRSRILAKAIERGLVKEADAQGMSEDEVTGLVFLPGFSTADRITDISGRGVGLDVVKKFVDEMGGAIRVRTRPGLGTTMTISLPLTMAIIRAILVETSRLLYAIPISSVSEVVMVEPGAYTLVRGERVILLREEMLPVVRLRDLLVGSAVQKLPEDAPQAGPGPVVVVQYGGHRVGLIVSTVIGNTEVVVKSLGRHYREIEGLLGASILGNGRMAIILDVGVLLEMHFKGTQRALPSFQASAAAARASDAAQPSVVTPPPLREPAPARPAAPEPTRVSEPIRSPDPARELEPVREPEPAREPEPSLPVELADPSAVVETSGSDSPQGGLKDLEEVFSSSALRASQALTDLLGESIRVSFPETRFVPLTEVANRLGGEDVPVIRVYVDVREGLTGGHLLIVPVDRAMPLCDRLLGRTAGATTDIRDDELSSVAELGNILSAAFINSIADRMGISIHSDVPDVRLDMCLSTIDSLLARFQEPGSDILLTVAEVTCGESEQIVCHMMLFLERPSLALMRDALTGRVTPTAER